MSEYKIEQGHPLPDYKSSSYAKYPFDKMEIGDSFALNNFEDTVRVRSAASYYAKRSRTPKKFSVRINRCYRVA